MHNINFKDLEDKGYIVISNFLNVSEIDELVQKFVKQVKQDTSLTNPAKQVVYSNPTPEFLKDKCLFWCDLISKKSNINVSSASGNIMFFANNRVITEWHQDHDSYFYLQNSFYLNFWIPLIKTYPDKSGLKLIPHDRLVERDPEFFKKYVLGKGAVDYFEKDDDTTEVSCVDTGKKFSINFKINELEEIPSVMPGDAIIMRGDVIHKTQNRTDRTDFRVALSHIVYNEDLILSKEKFYTGSPKKQEYIEHNRKLYEKIIELFEKEDFIKVNRV